MKATFLSRFTPSMMKPEALEALFVQREDLARRLVELIRESALTQSKHHTLLVGPRGIGKTHSISLIYHRVRAQEDLRDRLLTAWLREEEWGVTSFLDLLLRIFRALIAEYGEVIPTERIEALYTVPSAQAEQTGAALLKEFVADRTLLVLVENLDDLFKGLGEKGQKRLRSYLQENLFCTILATVQSLFNEVSLQTSPFYGFFRIHHLQELTLEDATRLLTNIAILEGDRELAAFVQTPLGRARIRAVHHLAGGNHRVYVIFSQFLTRESLDEFVDPFMRTLDDLTPYYQARMAWLSAQQRKIIELLCDRRHAVSVKEIAQRCFLTPQTASSQLKTLKEMGYVRSESVGRESYYELREPLMRLCIEVKKNRGEPVRLFVDFLRIWYSRAELQERLTLLQPEDVLERQYVLHALQETEEETDDPRLTACLKDYDTYFEMSDFIHALEVAKELVVTRGYAEDWFRVGYCSGMLGYFDKALESFDKAIELEPNNASIWGNRGTALAGLESWNDAVASYDKSIDLDPKDENAWTCRGAALGKLGHLEEALVSIDKAIELAPGNGAAWKNRKTVLLNLGRWDEALTACDRILRFDPKNIQCWHQRGWMLVQLQRWDEALTSFEKVIELDPHNTTAWSNRGAALGTLRRFDEALAACNKAIELDPNNLAAWDLRGLALKDLGSYEEALASFEKASEDNRRPSRIFFGRAETLLALNRWDEGIAALDNALQRFARGDEPVTGDPEAVVSALLNTTRDRATWRTRAAVLIDLYNKHQVLSVLGKGLVESISELAAPAMSAETARIWRDMWQELTSNLKEFALPLRLLDAAVRYRETHDQRVLLELPVEERKLLEPLLEPQNTTLAAQR